MKSLTPWLALALLILTGCREIWYYQPMGGTHRDVRDGKGHWINLGEVELGSWAPFVVAPWTPGDSDTIVGFRIQNLTEDELKIQDAHILVGKLLVRSDLPVTDNKNGEQIPPRGASDFSLWITFPAKIKEVPAEFILRFDLVTPDGVRRKEVRYSN